MEQPSYAPVLIVEDDHDTRDLLQTVLQDAGLLVATSDNGQDAVAWLEQYRPALILLDLKLEGMPGEIVAQRARGRYGRTLPILVVTGADHARERTEHAETFVYLAKPFDVAELLRVVRGLLGPEPPFGTFISATTRGD